MKPGKIVLESKKMRVQARQVDRSAVFYYKKVSLAQKITANDSHK